MRRFSYGGAEGTFKNVTRYDWQSLVERWGAEDSYFNWLAWPNFTDRGKAPQLKKYPLTDLAPATPTPLRNTSMTVTAYPLSHGGVESTAFLIESGPDALLCL